MASVVIPFAYAALLLPTTALMMGQPDMSHAISAIPPAFGPGTAASESADHDNPQSRVKRAAPQKPDEIQVILDKIKKDALEQVDAVKARGPCKEPVAILYGGSSKEGRVFLATMLLSKLEIKVSRECALAAISHDHLMAEFIEEYLKLKAAQGKDEAEECVAPAFDVRIGALVTELIHYCLTNRMSFLWDGALTNMVQAKEYKRLMDQSVSKAEQGHKPYQVQVVGVSIEAHVAAAASWDRASKTRASRGKKSKRTMVDRPTAFVPLCAVYRDAIRFAGLWQELVNTFADADKSNVHLYDVSTTKEAVALPFGDLERAYEALDVQVNVKVKETSKILKFFQTKKAKQALSRFKQLLELTPAQLEHDLWNLNGGATVLQGYKQMNAKCGFCGQDDTILVSADAYGVLKPKQLAIIKPELAEPCDDQWSVSNGFCDVPPGKTLKYACLNGPNSLRFRTECPRKCGRCYSQESFTKAGVAKKAVEEGLKKIEAEVLKDGGKLMKEYLPKAKKCAQPFAIFFGGGSGAGKGRAYDSFMKSLKEDKLVDLDAHPECTPFKITHDDYVILLSERLQKQNDVCFGPSVGREVGGLVSRLIAFCIKNKISFIWDGTLTNMARAKEYKQLMDDAGFHIHVVGITTAIPTAAMRSWKRGLLLHTAGYTPKSTHKRPTNAQIALCMVYESHTAFAKLFPEIVNLFYAKGRSSVHLYSNNRRLEDGVQLLFKDGAYQETFEVDGKDIGAEAEIQAFEAQAKLTPIQLEMDMAAMPAVGELLSGVDTLKGYKQMNVECGFCGGDQNLLVMDGKASDDHNRKMEAMTPISSAICKDRLPCEESAANHNDHVTSKCFESTAFRFNCPRNCGRCYSTAYVQGRKIEETKSQDTSSAKDKSDAKPEGQS